MVNTRNTTLAARNTIRGTNTIQTHIEQPRRDAVADRSFLIVSPEGVLHVLPNHKKKKIAFCKAHGMTDKKYVENMLAGRQTDSYGWQLLEKVRWLRQQLTGVIVPVVGKPKSFFDTRAAVCERAGLPSTAMPWADHEIRTFERLLDPASSTEEMGGGWKLLDAAPVTDTIQCSSTCATCLLSCVDLYSLLNPTEPDDPKELDLCIHSQVFNTDPAQPQAERLDHGPDEAALLRNQLAVAQKQLQQVTKERDEEREEKEKLAAAKKIILQTARRRQDRIQTLRDRMMKLKEASHTDFEEVLNCLPPPAKHLRHLWETQMRALRSNSLRTDWHEEILNWCAKIFRKDRGAYELMWSGQVLLLPHPDTVRKRCAANYAKPGHNDDRYETIRSEMATMSTTDRCVAVKFDEINTREDLVWKERDGEFELFGLAEVNLDSPLGPLPMPAPSLRASTNHSSKKNQTGHPGHAHVRGNAKRKDACTPGRDTCSRFPGREPHNKVSTHMRDICCQQIGCGGPQPLFLVCGTSTDPCVPAPRKGRHWGWGRMQPPLF